MSEKLENFSNKEWKSKNGTVKDTDDSSYFSAINPEHKQLSGFLFIQIRELLIETIVAPVVSLLVI
jgi:hypothetical protein